MYCPPLFYVNNSDALVSTTAMYATIDVHSEEVLNLKENVYMIQKLYLEF